MKPIPLVAAVYQVFLAQHLIFVRCTAAVSEKSSAATPSVVTLPAITTTATLSTTEEPPIPWTSSPVQNSTSSVLSTAKTSSLRRSPYSSTETSTSKLLSTSTLYPTTLDAIPPPTLTEFELDASSSNIPNHSNASSSLASSYPQSQTKEIQSAATTMSSLGFVASSAFATSAGIHVHRRHPQGPVRTTETNTFAGTASKRNPTAITSQIRSRPGATPTDSAETLTATSTGTAYPSVETGAVSITTTAYPTTSSISDSTNSGGNQTGEVEDRASGIIPDASNSSFICLEPVFQNDSLVFVFGVNRFPHFRVAYYTGGAVEEVSRHVFFNANFTWQAALFRVVEFNDSISIQNSSSAITFVNKSSQWTPIAVSNPEPSTQSNQSSRGYRTAVTTFQEGNFSLQLSAQVVTTNQSSISSVIKYSLGFTGFPYALENSSLAIVKGEAVAGALDATFECGGKKETLCVAGGRGVLGWTGVIELDGSQQASIHPNKALTSLDSLIEPQEMTGIQSSATKETHEMESWTASVFEARTGRSNSFFWDPTVGVNVDAIGLRQDVQLISAGDRVWISAAVLFATVAVWG